jgi:hypothetical protein
LDLPPPTSADQGPRLARAALHPRRAEIETIYPDWRGFDLILVNEQIVVIDPRTCEIVSVIEA